MGKLYNRAKMTVVSAPGTGTISLGSALVGFQSFSNAGVQNGDVVSYVLEDGSSWEYGQGTYNSTGPTLARTTINGSSNGGTAITATAGAIVYISPLAADFGNTLTVSSTGVSGGISGRVLYDNAGVVGELSTTGSGSVVLNTSPTLVTPVLGTPSSGNFSTGTFTWPTFNQNTTGTASGLSATLAVTSGGTGVTTSTGTGSVVLSTSPTLVTPLLGTPTSGNFSTGTFTWPTFNQNTTGTAAGLSATLAVTSGGTGVTTLTGLAKGNGTSAFTAATAGTDYLAPPSGTAILKAASGGALANAVAGTDYLAPPSGTAILKAASGGALANATAGTDYVAPGGALGTPSSGTLTNCTGLPASSVTGILGIANGGTGVSSLGTGVVTALGNATNATGGVTTVDGTATLTNKTLTNPTVTNYTETPVSIGNSGTTQTLSLTNGTFQTITMTGNCVFGLPTPTGNGGKSFVLIVSSGAGSFTGTFTSVKWPSNTAPTLTTTASRWDILSFFCDGTNWYGSFVQAFQ